MKRRKRDPESVEMFPAPPPTPLPRAWTVSDVVVDALVATMPKADLNANRASRMMMLQPAADLFVAHLRNTYGIDLVVALDAAREAYGEHHPEPVLSAEPYCSRCSVRIRRVQHQPEPYWRHVAVRRRPH